MAEPAAATNDDVARIFRTYATLLEIGGANRFRVRAYRNAAQLLEGLPEQASKMIAGGADLSELPGIGEDLSGKIEEVVNTGRLSALEKLEQDLPEELAELVELPGLGPKRVKELFEELDVKSIDDLRRALTSGRLSALPGFGEKTQAKLLKTIEERRGSEKRMRLDQAERVGEVLLEKLRAVTGVTQVTIAGSYRRRKETVGDLDILVTAEGKTDLIERFTKLPGVSEIVSKGGTRSTVFLRSGLQVDLRLVSERSYGAALHYFTGSKSHNIAVRQIAVKKGLKLNEYGLFKGEKQIAGQTETGIFKALGLDFVEPELRENTGEVEAAQKGRMPKLVQITDIRGDLHVHSKATDGRDSIKEMALAAKQRGYDYIAICDHTQHVKVAKGLDERRLRRQLEEIDRLNEGLKGIRILKSSEVDILSDGALDLPDTVLNELDFTVCAVHYKFDLSAKAQTERIIRAMDNPHFNILAHPTGRLIGTRQPYPIEMERLMEAALERGCFLEINGQPERRDLADAHCRMAKRLGLKLAVSTDAHSTDTLRFMRYGIDQARRGWLETEDVLNSRTWRALKTLLKRS